VTPDVQRNDVRCTKEEKSLNLGDFSCLTNDQRPTTKDKKILIFNFFLAYMQKKQYLCTRKGLNR